MSNPNISPGGGVNLLNYFKSSRSTVNIGMRDEASKTNVGQLRAAEKENSANVRLDVSPGTFHRFGDLPPEIRCTIWVMALPTRVVQAYSSKPAHRFSCSSRQRCKVCEAFNWAPPVRAPAVMQACREARRETQKLMRPLSTWMLEGFLPDQLHASWSRAQREEYMEKALYKEEMVPIITWFNARTDLIQIEPPSLRRFSELSGPPNHDDVFQVALDPDVNLLLFSYYFDEWEYPLDAFVSLRNGLQALYYRYLRTRKHVYIVVGGMGPYVLTDEGWEKAIREGLFSGHYEETRMIPLNDEVLIRKYEDLRHHCHQHIRPSRRPNMDSQLWYGKTHGWQDRRLPKFKNLDDAAYSRFISYRLVATRANLPDAQLFMLQIADFIMWDIGLGYGRGEEIMELDGHLKQDHPLVQQLDLRLPDFTPVLLFEARKPPVPDISVLLNRLPQMRTKIPEEDSSRGRLFLRRWGNNFLKRWGRSL